MWIYKILKKKKQKIDFLKFFYNFLSPPNKQNHALGKLQMEYHQ
jgi:hypothetical protein